MAKLEVICGPMFAGKTEELIRRVKRCTFAGQRVQVFKPLMDHRFGVDRITSHGKTDLEAATGIKPMAVEDGERLASTTKQLRLPLMKSSSLMNPGLSALFMD